MSLDGDLVDDLKDTVNDYEEEGASRFEEDADVEATNDLGVEGNHNSELYNERGREELTVYEQKFKDSLEESGKRDQVEILSGLPGKKPFKHVEPTNKKRAKEDVQDEKQGWISSEKVPHGSNKSLGAASVSEDEEDDNDVGGTDNNQSASGVVVDEEQDDESVETEGVTSDANAATGNKQGMDDTATAFSIRKVNPSVQ